MTNSVGVISDVHGNLPALEATLDELHRLNVDKIVCCGDLIGIHGWNVEVCERIREEADVIVYGNHDARMRSDTVFAPSFQSARDEMHVTSETLDESTIEWLDSLPERYEDEEFIVAHSWPKEMQDKETSVNGFCTGDFGVTKRLATKAGTAADGKLVMLGHTHDRFTLELSKFPGQEGRLLNPGSVGVPWYEPASFAVATRDGDGWEVDFHDVEYDYNAVKENMESFGLTVPSP